MPGHVTLTAPSVQALATYLAARRRRTARGSEVGRVARVEVAAALGCSPRTLTRALSLLAAAGAVEVEGGRVIIRDDLRLEAVAAGAACTTAPASSPALDTPAVVGAVEGMRDELVSLRAEVARLGEVVRVLTECVLRSTRALDDDPAQLG